jgi:UDP-N-acetylglucosamine 4,6-dehydratase
LTTNSRAIFSNKIVAVTGGTGSFGHIAVRELLKCDPAEIIIYSRDEEKQWEMSREFPDKRITFRIGDVRDLDRCCECLNADYVFHAAALKIIPTCEANPSESYKTNTLGAANVKEACTRNKVKKSLFVSTDKATKPVNVYGMCKALGEKLWLSGQGTTRFSVVRYGNVVGSRGSIVPLFRQLIKEGKPISITDVTMSRFWLTLSQSVDLVFYATTEMQGGEIYVPICSASNVMTMVQAITGKSDYPVQVVGIRPGEKLAEVLISEEEIRRTSIQQNCYVILPHGTAASGLKHEFTSDTARQLNVDEVKALL